MPVKFKGKSDYKQNFKWFDSYRSKSFVPTCEQAVPSAGMETTKASLVTEPPLQRRRKVAGPPVSLSTEFYDPRSSQPARDFALLGQNEKFASNVQYRPKSGNFNNNNRAMSPPKQLRMEKQHDQIIDKARPAPIVDTQKFVEPQMPPTPLAPRGDPGQVAVKTKMVQAQPKSKSVPQKTSDNTATQKVKDKSVQNLPLKQAAVKSKTKENEAPVKQALKDKNLSDVLGEMKKKKPSMNEFTQANTEKGVLDSAPEAPAEYAMKYKAGVAPARPSRKQSEYQREFEWKNRVGSSPMLAAEQIVYNSKVGPVKTSGFPKTSEYKAQFKKWRAVENEPVPAVKRAVQQMAAVKQKALKRSKSVGAVEGRGAARRASSVDQDRDAGQDEAEEDVTKAEVPKAQPHHGKLRRVVTEYAANFKSPQKFSFDKGAWKGADPPHLYAQKPEVTCEEPPLKSWFAEVLELRRKANEYKKRAQGTHFSREHLVQLMAKQAGFWDIPTARSSSSSTLSALSLEAGNLVHKTKKQIRSKKESEKNLVDFESCKATIADSETPSELEDGIFEERQAAGKKNRKMAWSDENMEQNQVEEDAVESVISPSASYDTPQGRIPTPQWRHPGKTSKKTRHHLDRTTPAVGGAILTSPPHPVTQSRSSRSGSSQDTLEDESERKQFGKTYNLNRLLTTPTFGQPSHDTHMLRDDDASVDQPLKTTYVYTPAEDLSDPEQQVVEEPVDVAPVRRQSRRKERMRPAGVPSTLHEQMAQTYTKPVLNLPPDSEPAEDNDDNVSLSLSVRSIASSCSLVSDIYERSKNRRDNFWRKGDIATR
ncbi:nuclear protein MDM1-like isoform X2 [Haliotis rubra]|uniref:nuclear protein MDM1-like isoform X2 n=1 Tax=Haliotis rubra TaxID=36100 RepID=UPI001EE5E5B9|nr:nuclear protein MDM1-like isoform X2 [Haliotis rubra]